MHGFSAVCSASPTCASELLAFNLAYTFVGQSPGVAAARSTGLDGIIEQVICQPLQVTVTHERILGQVTWKEEGKEAWLKLVKVSQ